MKRCTGILYQTGSGVPVDAANAVKYFKMAAEQKHSFAYQHLAFYFEDQPSTEENRAEVRDFFIDFCFVLFHFWEGRGG
jgi:TPR repeat protein